METRLSGGDVALEPQNDDGEEATRRSPTWPTTPTSRRGSSRAQKRDRLAADGIALALDALDARSRRIVEERWLKVNDDSSGGMTLHDLAAEYGVSAERIRQIEVAAMKKMRKALTSEAARALCSRQRRLRSRSVTSAASSLRSAARTFRGRRRRRTKRRTRPCGSKT